MESKDDASLDCNNDSFSDIYSSDESDYGDYKSTSSSNESLDEINDIELPVAKYKNEIIKAVSDNQVVIITGKTGCGKTTQVPQYLLDAGLNNNRIIGMTQPRPINAVSIATRIAKERRCVLGREVGYQKRFDTRLSSSTKIKVMTEGILLNDIRSDKWLRDYGVIIIDEVHERSTNCDILLGLLKDIVVKRRDLRIVICSATINSRKLLDYFENAKIVEIKGRRYPVEVIYSKDKIESIVHEGLHPDHRGDILIFIAGVGRVLACCMLLQEYVEKKRIENIIIFPLYAGIGIEAQKKALKPVKSHQTKIIVSTNIAESSLTIEGIRIVIDEGLYKSRDYIPRPDIVALEDESISKAQAEQRRGRAGRTGPGKCYRLYTEKDYLELCDDNFPAILKENLADMYLSMIAMDVNPRSFDYLDPPPGYKLRYAEEELESFSLIDNERKLTSLGKDVSELPIGLRLGLVIQNSLHKNCMFTVLCICSMITEEYIFLQPSKKDESNKARKRQRKFYDRDGDHFTLMNLYKEWKVQDNQKRWCYRYYINLPIMKELDMIIEQIYMRLRRKGLMFSLSFVDDREEIKKSFVSVFYKNICEDNGLFIERIYDSQIFEISKNSHYMPYDSVNLCLFIKAVWIPDPRFNDKYINFIMAVEPHIIESDENFVNMIKMLWHQ